MTGERRRVICLGTAVVDTIYAVERLPLAPGKNYARSVLRIGGGVAANAAVTVSALGGEGILWSRVGADPVGDEIVRELAEWRVDVRGVRQMRGPDLADLDRVARPGRRSPDRQLPRRSSVHRC